MSSLRIPDIYHLKSDRLHDFLQLWFCCHLYSTYIYYLATTYCRFYNQIGLFPDVHNYLASRIHMSTCMQHTLALHIVYSTQYSLWFKFGFLFYNFRCRLGHLLPSKVKRGYSFCIQSKIKQARKLFLIWNIYNMKSSRNVV